MKHYYRTFFSSSFCLTLGAVAAFIFPASAHAKKPEVHQEQLCPRLIIQWAGKDKVSFTDMEKRLMCGDLESNDPLSLPWKNIPNAQSKFHLNTFLQDRGYYQPSYVQNGEGLIADLGPPTIVTQIDAEGAPEGVELGRHRGMIGERLTPKVLSLIEQWIHQRLQGEGYACPKVVSEADPVSGTVLVHIDPGMALNIAGVIEENSTGVAPGILRRYDAFRLGYRFNGDLLALSERRIVGSGIVETMHFTNQCTDKGVFLKQEAVAGLPRLLTVGFGIDTEGLFRVKAGWKNTRMGKTGSQLEFAGQGSLKEQTVNANLNWYHHDYPSRNYIRPLVEFRHENENFYEFHNERVQISEAATWDNQALGAAFRVGPTVDFFQEVRGQGPRNSHFLSMESELRVMSHYFEFYRGSPRTGYQGSLVVNATDREIGSSATAQRFKFTGEAIWNYRNFDPPLWIVALRGGLNSTFTAERPGPGIGLPAPFRSYLGGSTNLRGFGRKELPNESGGLSSAFADLELRLGSVLPYGFQPFTFMDAGEVGMAPMAFDSPLFWSPGIGLRWESPIGSFRTTLARGYVTGNPDARLSHLQFYFSFGEEF